MDRSLHKFAALFLAAGIFAGCEEVHDDPGTALTRRLSVPADAAVVAEGAGELSYKAHDDGKIFIFDVDDQLVENAKHMRAGQKIVLQPDANLVKLDSEKILGQDLKGTHTHRLYFEKE